MACEAVKYCQFGPWTTNPSVFARDTESRQANESQTKGRDSIIEVMVNLNQNKLHIEHHYLAAVPENY